MAFEIEEEMHFLIGRHTIGIFATRRNEKRYFVIIKCMDGEADGEADGVDRKGSLS